MNQEKLEKANKTNEKIKNIKEQLAKIYRLKENGGFLERISIYSSHRRDECWISQTSRSIINTDLILKIMINDLETELAIKEYELEAL